MFFNKFLFQGLQKSSQEKAPNEIFMTERQKGEKEEGINIPASKLRGSCLRSSNVSNDTDKSFSNNLDAKDALSDSAKQQSAVSYTDNNSDTISRTSCSQLEELNGRSNVTNNNFSSPSTKKQNIYRSRENLSLIDSEEIDGDSASMENGFPLTKPSDEELNDFLEYIEKGQAPDENIEYEQDLLRKRTAAELGKIFEI